MEKLTKKMKNLSISSNVPQNTMTNLIRKFERVHLTNSNRKRRIMSHNNERASKRPRTEGRVHLTNSNRRVRTQFVLPNYVLTNFLYNRMLARRAQKQKENKAFLKSIPLTGDLFNAVIANFSKKRGEQYKNIYNPNKLLTANLKIPPAAFGRIYTTSNKNMQKLYSNKLESLYGPFMYDNFNRNSPVRSYDRFYNHIIKSKNFHDKYFNWRSKLDKNKATNRSIQNARNKLLNSLEKLRPTKVTFQKRVEENLKNLYNSTSKKTTIMLPKNRSTTILAPSINKTSVKRFIKYISHPGIRSIRRRKN